MHNIARIGVVGSNGRMGRQLIKSIIQTPGVILGAVIVNSCPWLIGRDAGELVNHSVLGIPITDNLDKVINNFDILIDFTSPQGTLTYLSFCKTHYKSMVIGTTGLNDLEIILIKNASQEIPIVCSSNFSIGATLTLKVVEKIAKVMGECADIEIIETHHRKKVDSPSGTALTMGKAIAKVMKWDFNQRAVYPRDRVTGPRLEKTIGFTSIRCGNIVGEHKALFADTDEHIEISHKALDRSVFAKGAITAALWLRTKKTGFFNMIDVLELQDI
ncbi:4-hydroxy-tetrahydrodipicolinate reductase [Candidatus Erwinia haradaeae]|uniref:4-hydroxy-tetrahydrodipicolinate reductase n=2 Tax=Candidatus Erwinia haradaeae TaxID=1922217 RepID=A0A451D4G7_9GAMM|nr:4-hydroxy-tetrahydrodipicolinate reductase [Candidatus Erwinia haradaeae]VFP80556.1 4-hydroxy-tetrahydrodipicolinate reductase [Candidatus Erwinia haradaeae]